ncbi:NADPH-dependent FMN reductase [Dongia sedimenti]|uniref:NADPH-dependent FMN reductase n=1 Tax=Dongia sedimenti TaxID=3064282 RepID=A0ABU0YTW3_9PROT|nr:NADPH-dependent FMN reductase [Rhodospirillaceae bacterium R-7]
MSETPPLSVVSICGSLRKGSFNAAVQRSLPELAPSAMSIQALSGIAEIPLYNADLQAEGFAKPVTDMADAIRKADGLIICSPEYNYSIPGALKNAIDWLSRLKEQPFAGKPILLQSASGGALGGVRMQYHLRQVMVFLEALVFNRPEVFVGSAQTKFDGDLKLTDQASRDIIKQQLAGFETFIRRIGR